MGVATMWSGPSLEREPQMRQRSYRTVPGDRHVGGEARHEGGRQEAGERGQHGRDPQEVHAGQDLQLELVLRLDEPAEREGPAPLLNVPHALPRGEGGAREPAAQEVVARHAVRLEELRPDVLLPREGQREVDAAQRHPVQFLLPPRPVPPGHAVGCRADVHVITPAYGRVPPESRHDAPEPRGVHRLQLPPRRAPVDDAVFPGPGEGLAVVAQVPAEASGERQRGGAADSDHNRRGGRPAFAPAPAVVLRRRELEHVVTVGRRGHRLEGDAVQEGWVVSGSVGWVRCEGFEI